MFINKMNKNKDKIDEIPIDYDLFIKLQPQGGITFKSPSFIQTGDGYVKCIHIYQLPSIINDFWLNDIMRFDDTICLFDISETDKNKVQKNINKSIREEIQRARYATDFEEAYDAEERKHQLQSMYNEIKSMGEIVKMVQIRIMVFDKTLIGLEEKTGKIMEKLESNDFMPTVLLNENKNQWNSIFETYKKQQEKNFAIKGMPLLTEQIAGGYPFSFSYLQDQYGSLLGFTKSGGIVSFDEFTKSKKRRYYNSIIVGDLGSGKSTLLKKRFRERASRGDIVRTFDISGEFTGLTKEFGGKIIKCNGKDGMMNPLEILRSGDDDSTNYARHISKVSAFYKCLMPEVTDQDSIELQVILKDIYEKWELTPKDGRKITGLKANKYPIFSDVIEHLNDHIKETIKKAKEECDDLEKNLLSHDLQKKIQIKKTLISLVDNYGKMFNGYTSIDNINNEKIVTFDISDIKDLGNIFVAQLFNMIYFTWDGVVENGSIMKQMFEEKSIDFQDVTRSLVIIDESHRWINTKYPRILELITIMLREARKYFAGIMQASQSFRDYIPESKDEASIDKLKVVFELSQYKFIFRQDSSVLPLIEKVLGNILSPWQIMKVPFLEEGETILSITGDRNILFNVWLSPEYERTLFAGGV